MVIIDFNKIIKDDLENDIINYLNDISFSDNETYDFIFPNLDIYDNDKIFKNFINKIYGLNLNLKQYKGGLYFSSPNTEYLYLYKGIENKELEIPSTVKRIEAKAFKELNYDNINIYAKNCYIANNAFYFTNSNNFNFIDNDNITLDWNAISYSKINKLEFNGNIYNFKGNVFNGSSFKYLILPKNLNILNNINCNIDNIYIPNTINNMEKISIYASTTIYYEGDCHKLLLEASKDEEIITSDDYSHNYYTSSGSFSSTLVHKDARYAIAINHHSYINLDDFKKIIK